MVTIDEALKIIRVNTNQTNTVSVKLSDGLEYALSEPIHSPINMPPFNQSAMDGYALSFHEHAEYKLIGEVKAGDSSLYELKPGEAIRIFTGAAVPTSTNVVAKQEIVRKEENKIILEEQVKIGENIRPLGEQIKKHELAFPKGTRLNPGAIGYAASLGLTHVNVYRKPVITVLATGNELVKPGENLENGKIFESNTFMLEAALKKSGLEAHIGTVHDELGATKNEIKKALDASDLVIITGGISVGDYDFVEQALEELNVSPGFYKVKQKPGKPLFFGHKDNKVVFALPGNPAAVLSCFYVYVLPCIKLMTGHAEFEHEIQKFELICDYKKTAKMTHFLKARAKMGKVEILKAQSSAMLSSFVSANCLIQLDQGREEWKSGDTVSAIMLPQ